MRIVRFSPGPNSGLGTDPLFGLLEEDGANISVIAGDPIYAGVSKPVQSPSYLMFAYWPL